VVHDTEFTGEKPSAKAPTRMAEERQEGEKKTGAAVIESNYTGRYWGENGSL